MPDSTRISTAPENRFLGVLDQIVANKRQEIALRRESIPLEQLITQVEALPPLVGFAFEKALALSMLPSGQAVHLIAEIKPSSPSAGVLRPELSLDRILEAYNQSASAISVLTDEKYFGGTLERLAQVSTQSQRPTLCKDFVLDDYLVYEARLAGASAVLLIVKILDDASLAHLHHLIRTLGMTPVVEVQNEDELTRALAVDADVLLINNRNLSTFDIDLGTTSALVDKMQSILPEEKLGRMTVISASGIETRADIDRLLPSVRCFLIGSSLMKKPIGDLPQALAELAGHP